MTRRDFLSASLGASALTALSACRTRGAVSREAFPDWAVETMDAAIGRFRAWAGDDEVVSFVFMTDVHSFLVERPAVPDYSDSRQHFLFARHVADRVGCDFLIDGGDHDFENGVKSPDESLRRMEVSRSFYEEERRPCLFCLGNHDHGRWTRDGSCPVSSQLFGETFNGIARRHGHRIVAGADLSYGYHDVPAKRFRAIYVNTSDVGYEGLSGDQLAFVSSALGTLPEGWTTAVFGHVCVLDEIGHWKRSQYGSRGIPGKEAFVSLLERFARQRPNALTGYFCGDSHFDNAYENRGVNYTISQGMGGCDDVDVPWGARRAPAFDRNVPGTFARQTLFELVGVNPRKGVFRLFRVGAGGAAFDRICRYWNKP